MNLATFNYRDFFGLLAYKTSTVFAGVHPFGPVEKLLNHVIAKSSSAPAERGCGDLACRASDQTVRFESCHSPYSVIPTFSTFPLGREK